MSEQDTTQTEPAADPEARSWDFPGWGSAERINDLDNSPVELVHLDSPEHDKLDAWRATAICGNDITSSCLYVTAIAMLFAGPYAPVALGLVAFVLYLFRGIYAEVGLALPLNGGAYNVLLNTTTKGQASVAACLTLLSYIATAVLSANSAMHYAHNIVGSLPVFAATVGVLCLFALLALLGIGESANAALAIFTVHIATLFALCLLVGIRVAGHWDILIANAHHPPPVGVGHAIFFGFAAAMLGISGFESSANFIEEQKPGVFPLTLRNMWAAVAVFNPLISLLALALLPLPRIVTHANDLLAVMGASAGGAWLEKLVSVDAVLVLSGAVLTSYVGVTGLMRRMSLDRCLPQFLLVENRWRKTNHWIILAFCGLCCSILAITHGRLIVLAGVYTIAFLSVMSLFAVGNILLKVRRSRLPRQTRAGWPAVVLALAATIAALVGNILLNPGYVQIFLIYFAVAAAIVGAMFQRVNILKLFLILSEATLERLNSLNARVKDWIIGQVQAINQQRVIFFSKSDDISLLNEAALYVLRNEQNKRLQVVHCYRREEDIPPGLALDLATLDRIYPDLRIDLLLVKGDFGPDLIEHLSRRLNVPKNYMFIGTPGDRFPHEIASLGGVRLIM